MQKKRTRIAAVAMALTLSLTAPAVASIGVQLNGQPLTFDVPPVVEAGRTLVPVRAIFEALGARITWDEASQTISAVHPERNRYVILKLGSTTAWVDGREVTLDVAPRVIDGRTMVPLRFVSTALDARIDWDPATETVLITQEPLAPAPTASEQQVDGRALSRYTRAVAYTQLDESWYCSLGTPNRVEDYEYIFATGDAEYLEYVQPYLAETITCWQQYEEQILSTLTPPPGAEAAHAALQFWVDLNQSTLAQLQLADAAHTKGEIAARDGHFQGAVRDLIAALAQEEEMLAAMDAITATDAEFLTVTEHLYFAWFDGMMGLTDTCLSQLRMIRHTENEERFWAEAAAQCMVALPEVLSELEPPTARMQGFRTEVFTQLAPISQRLTAFAQQLAAGPIDPATVSAEIEAIHEQWFALQPTWEQLFVYRDWGK